MDGKDRPGWRVVYEGEGDINVILVELGCE